MPDLDEVAAPVAEPVAHVKPAQAVQVVAVVTDIDDGLKAERDSSNDTCFVKFVLCIVKLPLLVIGITLGVSFVIAGARAYIYQL
jgi:hypothetical protein